MESNTVLNYFYNSLLGDGNKVEPKPENWGYLVFYIFTIIYVGIAFYFDFWYQKQQQNEETNRSRNSQLVEDFN